MSPSIQLLKKFISTPGTNRLGPPKNLKDHLTSLYTQTPNCCLGWSSIFLLGNLLNDFVYVKSIQAAHNDMKTQEFVKHKGYLPKPFLLYFSVTESETVCKPNFETGKPDLDSLLASLSWENLKGNGILFRMEDSEKSVAHVVAVKKEKNVFQILDTNHPQAMETLNIVQYTSIEKACSELKNAMNRFSSSDTLKLSLLTYT